MCIWYILLKMIKVSNPKFINGFKKRNESLIFRIPSYFINIKLISITGMCFPLSWSKAWSSPSSRFRPGGGGLQVAAVRVRQPELGHLRRIWVIRVLRYICLKLFCFFNEKYSLLNGSL